ncbi:TolC family protein [Bryobacter aggregatus]|uniref:TolC family protein n=1 Tax=Bryobacter aggregatus TaxID=360054 RepID=UPI0004E13AD4|nr:TolC family protein [Bryobacter aggregatus]
MRLIFGHVALVAVVFAGQSEPNGRVITFGEAIQLADQHNPQLQAGSAQVAAARSGIVTANAYPNPEAGMIAGRQTYRVPGNVSGLIYSFGVSQPLELGGLRPARRQLAERGIESSRQALEETRLAVLSTVRRAFYQVLRRQGEIAIHVENLRLVEDLRNRIQVLVEVGEAGRLELVRADAEVTTARSTASSARIQYVAALSQLRAAIGTELPTELRLQGELDAPITLPPIEEFRKLTLERNPAYALALAEVRRAEARLGYESAQVRPQPSLRVEVDRPPDSPTYRAGISIPLPFWNRREGPILEAQALITQARAIANSRQLELIAEVEGAYRRYEVVTEQLAAYREGVLREAEEALRGAQAAYQLGERGILEVLDAQRVLRTVRLDLLHAQFDRQAALIDLDELKAVDLRRQQP